MCSWAPPQQAGLQWSSWCSPPCPQWYVACVNRQGNTTTAACVLLPCFVSWLCDCSSCIMSQRHRHGGSAFPHSSLRRPPRHRRRLRSSSRPSRTPPQRRPWHSPSPPPPYRRRPSPPRLPTAQPRRCLQRQCAMAPTAAHCLPTATCRCCLAHCCQPRLKHCDTCSHTAVCTDQGCNPYQQATQPL